MGYIERKWSGYIFKINQEAFLYISVFLAKLTPCNFSKIVIAKNKVNVLCLFITVILNHKKQKIVHRFYKDNV